MSKFVTLWVTKAGAEYFEEPTEYPSHEDAVRDVLNNIPANTGESDADDRIFFKDIQGSMVVLRGSRIDHAVVIPAEKVEVRENE